MVTGHSLADSTKEILIAGEASRAPVRRERLLRETGRPKARVDRLALLRQEGVQVRPGEEGDGQAVLARELQPCGVPPRSLDRWYQGDFSRVHRNPGFAYQSGSVFHTPVGARTAATGFLMALGAGGGILHLGGRERISRHDLGTLLAEMLGADAGLIGPGRQRDRAIGGPPPADVSLDSSRAYALGYDPPWLHEDLASVLAASR